MPAYKLDPMKYDGWSRGAVADELRLVLTEAEAHAVRPHRYLDRAKRVAWLVGLLRRKGVTPEKEDMQNVEVLRRQLDLVIAAAATAKAMLDDVGSQPAAALPNLQVVKPVPSDPTVALRVEIAHFIAQGLAWDQFIDRCSQDLVVGSQRQFSEFGPGRGASGRRSVDGW